MGSDLAMRVFPPIASSAEDQQVTVWLLGGSPPFMLDPYPPKGVDVRIAGTGRTWCLRVRGGAPGSIALVGRDYAGGVVTSAIDLVGNASVDEHAGGPPRMRGERPA